MSRGKQGEFGNVILSRKEIKKDSQIRDAQGVDRLLKYLKYFLMGSVTVELFLFL